MIAADEAKTLGGLFRRRLAATPNSVAYRYFDAASQSWTEMTWRDFSRHVSRWAAGLSRMGLQPGDRVAIMLANGWQWACFDQAAITLGLVTVPLYVNDRPDNVGFILQDTGSRLLVIDGEEQWRALRSAVSSLPELEQVISLSAVTVADGHVIAASEWLPQNSDTAAPVTIDSDQLATIVYTSGTVGRPKGVMLSHRNILWNAEGCLRSYPIYPDDLFLSFLPLSHTLERTVGYYLPMMAGATVAYARSIPQLGEDLVALSPTILISVPRIYERIYGRICAQLDQASIFARHLFWLAVEVGWTHFLFTQGRKAWSPTLLAWPLLKRLVARKVLARLGGDVRIAVCGGAPLSLEVARLFIGLGLPLVQGYGMTEASPVISANLLDDNDPASVGVPLQDVEIRVDSNDELLARSPGVMLGYWGQAEATAKAIDEQGWLHTGDKAVLSNGRIYITGRIKEIIVLSNGEKVSPADMELAIATDALFEQVMVYGEGRPFLIALVVPNPEQWRESIAKMGSDPNDEAARSNGAVLDFVCQRITRRLKEFPGYAQVRRVAVLDEPWTVENGLLTPTLKLRRERIKDRYMDDIVELYEGH